jgi:6-phosphogluconolactonase (cycloisomerase 2 family)
MNGKRWLTGASTLLVIAMLAACGGGGGDGSTAAPPPDNSAAAPPPGNSAAAPPPGNSAAAPPPGNVAGFAYVANQGSDNVSAYTINATTGELSEVAGSPFAAGDFPTSVSVDPSGKFAYVANSTSDNLSAYTINTTTGALSEVAGSPFAAGFSPRSIAVDPSGRFAYVAGTGVSAYTINAATGALTSVGTAVAAGTSPRSITVDPTGKFVYVGNSSSGDVSAYTINASTGALSEVAGSPYAAGQALYSVSIDPARKVAYVISSSVSVDFSISTYTINATTGALTSVGVPVAAEWGSQDLIVEPSGRFAYVPNAADGRPTFDGIQPNGQVTAYAINTTTGSLTRLGAAVAAGSGPRSVTVDPSGKFAYVANSGFRVGSGNVSAYTINATTGALTSIGAAVAAGISPYSITTTRKIQ